jgi:hypothetical protein
MSEYTPKQPVKDDNVTSLKPEFVRIPAAVRYSGISRTTIYELINEGRLKSTVLRRRGNVRGIRLISLESLDAILRGEA